MLVYLGVHLCCYSLRIGGFLWNEVRGWNSKPCPFVQDETVMSIETITLEVDIPVSVVILLSFLGTLSRSRSVMLIDVVG